MTVPSLRRGSIGLEPEDNVSRVMQCVECDELVRVYEPTGRWVDERDFVCMTCVLMRIAEAPE